MEYLRKADIIFINQKTVKRHGGNFVPPDNFLNEAPLDYLIDVISSEMFGEPLSSQKSTDLTSPYSNEILLEFVLIWCQAWFERNIIKL